MITVLLVSYRNYQTSPLTTFTANLKLHTNYRLYANNPRIFFPEFSEEKLGCAQYLKQRLVLLCLETNDPVMR